MSYSNLNGAVAQGNNLPPPSSYPPVDMHGANFWANNAWDEYMKAIANDLFNDPTVQLGSEASTTAMPAAATTDSDNYYPFYGSNSTTPDWAQQAFNHDYETTVV
jgi:hypothetical protein